MHIIDSRPHPPLVLVTINEASVSEPHTGHSIIYYDIYFIYLISASHLDCNPALVLSLTYYIKFVPYIRIQCNIVWHSAFLI